MFVNKWYYWLIGLGIIAASITIPVAVFSTLNSSDACSSEDTSTCEAAKGNCTNVGSTWKCVCNEGYMNAEGTFQTCEDIDECETGNTSSCEADKGICVNKESTWKCYCRTGYRHAVGDKQTCEDIDECLDGDTSSCEAGKGNCVNMNSTWMCDCNDGYRHAAGDTQTCEDVDECIDGDTSSCKAGKGNCVNLPSTWKCDCNEGYWNAEGDPHTCEDDPCGISSFFTTEQGELAFPSGSHLKYPNYVDCTWNLVLNPGKVFILTFTEFAIQWDSECALDYLELQDGFNQESLSTNKFCGETKPGIDGVYFTKHNTIRLAFHSDDSETKTGFKVTWRTDIDECSTGDAFSCEAGKGSCINLDGTWRCDCNEGFRNPEGDTQTCEDILCSETDTSSCVSGTGHCVSMDLTWRCHCNEGYINSAGDDQTCEDIDECSSGDSTSCEAGTGTCINMESTWRCECNEEHKNPEGDTQKCEVPLCGMTTEFNTNEGELEFPIGDGLIYPDNADCVWTLLTSPDKLFILTFTRFDIENITDCEHDYLEIQGFGAHSTYREKFCGTTKPGSNGVYSFPDSYIKIEFHSQNEIGGEGFKLTWRTVTNYCVIEDTSSCEAENGHCVSLESTWVCDCEEANAHLDGDTKTCVYNSCGDQTEFTTEEGVIDFPAGNHLTYPSETDCAWTLSTTSAKIFLFQFERFALEATSGCYNDYLEVKHGLNPESPTVDTLCGFEMPGKNGLYYAYHADIRLVFHSNHFKTYEGFKLTWTTVENHCATKNASSCETGTGNCITLESTWICDCAPGYYNPEGDTKTCELIECGNKTQTSAGEGTLEYPGGGGNYSNFDDCVWFLRATPGKFLTLTFSKFNIAYFRDCERDYLEIRDGSMSGSGITDILCGTALPGLDGVYTTTLNEIRLAFHSDEYTNGEGFVLNWTSVADNCAFEDTSSCEYDKGLCLNFENTWRCDCHPGYENPDIDVKTCELIECGDKTQTSAGEGMLEYPGFGASKYNSSQHCLWTLTATPGKVLELAFSKFEIERSINCVYDYLEIHEGSMSGSTLIDRLCHLTTGGFYTTSSNEIHLVFHSNADYELGGFTVTWTSVGSYCHLEDTSSCAEDKGYCRNLENTWKCECYGDFVNPDIDMKTCDVLVSECGVRWEISPGEERLEYPGTGGYYEPNQDCIWVLTTAPGKAFNFDFDPFILEDNLFCAFDYLEIHEGSTSESTVIDRFCWGEIGIGGEYSTNFNEILLVFHSDYELQGLGFKVTWMSVINYCVLEDTSSCVYDKGYCRNLATTWKCECYLGFENPDIDMKTCEGVECKGRTQTSAEEGTLDYPGGRAFSYDDNVRCSWTLKTTPGKVLTLTFEALDIEFHNACIFDFLEIHDPSLPGTTDIAKFCGSELPGYNGLYTTTLNELRLDFFSDTVYGGKGFKLTWTSDAGVCPFADTSSCVSDRGYCVPKEQTWKCHCYEGYFNPAGNDQTCEASLCGMTTKFTTPEGELEFPIGDGVIYPDDAQCLWTFSTTTTMFFIFTFTRFDIEDIPHCAHDYLKIQGLGAQSPNAEKLCGTTKPGSNVVYPVADSHITIEFHSQNEIGGEGFKLTWRTVENYCVTEDTSSCEVFTGDCVSLESTWICKCRVGYGHLDGDTKTCHHTVCGLDTEFTAETGEIDFPADNRLLYTPFTSCVWTVSTTPGKLLLFTFEKFRVEEDSACRHDYIQFKDGLSPGWSLGTVGVDKFCGTTLPGKNGLYYANHGNIILQFHSNHEIQEEGFNLTWSSVENPCNVLNTSSCETPTGNCIPLDSSWMCNCMPDYKNPDGDNKTCERIIKLEGALG